MGTRNNAELLIELFNNYVNEGNDPKLTYFMQHVTAIAREHVKPLCVGSPSRPTRPSGAVSDDWRSAQKARYYGRNRKWLKVSIDEITPTLDGFDARNIDTTNYRAWIEAAGFAWVRYRGPKVNRGVNSAQFEVPLADSRVNHPNYIHFIPTDNLDNYEHLSGTPHGLGLETAKPQSRPVGPVKEVSSHDVSDVDDAINKIISGNDEEVIDDEDLDSDGF